MNPTPLHPLITHIPLALVFILPVLTLLVTLFIKKGQFTKQTWLLIVGLQCLVLVTGYMSLESGEQEEMMVEQVTGKLPISEHEAKAEMMMAGVIVASAVSVVGYMIKPALQFYLQLATVMFMLINTFLAWHAGASGYGLVYKYGAANAYISAQNQGKEAAAANGLLPTPGQNTSESENPTDDADGSHEGDEAPTERDETEDQEPETPTN